MNDAASTATDATNAINAEPSWLLWWLGTLVAFLAAHVAIGWVMRSRRAKAPALRWGSLGVAAAALGTGICAAAVLSLAAEPLAFTPGYRGWGVPLAWVAAVAGSALTLGCTVPGRGLLALMPGGLLLALLAAALQVGWILAAGFKPGVAWQSDLVTAALVLLVVGCCTGLWMAFSIAEHDPRHRRLWRAGAALLLGLSLMGGQELLMVGAGVTAQLGSAYAHEVPGAALSLVCAVLVPMLLGAMAIDLALRRHHDRHPPSGRVPRRRRRRQRTAGP